MSDEKILSSDVTSDVPLIEDLYSYLRRGLIKMGHNTSCVDLATGREYKASELLDNVNIVAKQLLRHGFRRGDCMALYAVNHVEYVVVVMATLRLGGHVATVNFQLTAGEARTLVDLCDAVFMYTSTEVAGNAIKAARDSTIKMIFCRDEYPGCVSYSSLLKNLPSVFLPSLSSLNIQPAEETAAILFSSGTTGPQKAVMLSHYCFIISAGVMGGAATKTLCEHQIVYVPMSHMFGFGLMLYSIGYGHCSLIMKRYDPKVYLETIVKYKITRLQMPPPIALFLAKHPMVDNYDLSHVEMILTAAAPLSAGTEKEVVNRLGNKNLLFIQGYGMTETSGGVIAPITDDRFRPVHVPPVPPGSVGRLTPFNQIKIVDPESGQSLGPNQDGELWIRGPQLMLGYQKNKAQTESTIDREGWLHSGDIGRYDENGYFFITDRLKELIKYKGFQVVPLPNTVPPAELEALILTHPAVADCGVIGLPDLEAGELPHAWVVLRSETEATAKEIMDYVQGQVAQFKRLRGGVRFVERIPKTPSGKILRRQMRETAKQTE